MSDRKRVELPNTAPNGLRCPGCHCRHVPARKSVRRGDRMVRTRVCRNCGRSFTSSEKVVSNGDRDTP